MLDCITAKLNTVGISQNEIVTYCCGDLNLACQSCFTFLVLTNDKIIKIENKKQNASLNTEIFCDDDAEVTVFERKKCSHFKSVSNVSGITVSMMYENSAVALINSSNRFLDDIEIFKYACQKDILMPKKEKGGSGNIYEAQEQKDKKPFYAILRILKFYSPYKARFLLILLFIVLSSVINIITPYLSGEVLFGKVLDSQSPSSLTALIYIVIVLLVVGLISQFCFAATAFTNAKITPFVVRDIKKAVFKKMSSLSLGFYQSRKTGTLMTRVLDDAGKVSFLLVEKLPYTATDILTILSVSVIMFILNYKLAVAALILLPLSTVFSLMLMPKIYNLHGKQHRANRSLMSHLNDSLVGVKVIKAFGKENQQKDDFSKHSKSVRSTEMNLVKTENQIYALFQLVRQLSTIIVYALGSYYILSKSGEFSYATLITFTGYATLLSNPLDNLTYLFRQYSDFTNAANRIFEILDAKAKITQPQNAVKIENPKGEIELENVSFSYDSGKVVLKDISFKAKPNTLLGVVGYSGAGKSTLLNLISRLYDVDNGQILIDGVDIREIDFDCLRKMITVVSQETYIFSGTVMENILYANNKASPQEVIEAAKKANAHNFIMKMPDGYDTFIGASGRQLSGGERQRISIARAILANPKILILDEATASVDTKTEINIAKSIESLTQGRTTISVAHRLSTLKNADYLIVIDKGEIVERGTHQQLMEKQGLYYQLASLQSQQMIMKGDAEIE